MKKNIVFLLAISSLIFFGCSKEPMTGNGPQNGNINGNDNNTSGIKIEVVSGGGQKDTIGNRLANPIVVKVSQNGNPLSHYVVEFQGSGCNRDFPETTTTDLDGTANYDWYLAGDVGQQTLKIYAFDSQNQKADSVIVAATAIAGGSGWHDSGCAIPNPLGPMIVKLSTGKLFSFSNNMKSYLRYSTDNGASWYGVKNFANGHRVSWILVTPADKLYVFTDDEGTFYSSDAGQTWKQFSAPPLDAAHITGGIYTSKGKLIVTDQSIIAVSSDKGQTWTTTFPAGASGLVSPAEDKNGNLYVVDQTGGLIYKSKDEGATWTAVPKGSRERVSGFYIDKNGWFFKSGSDGLGFTGLYVSKNGGATYQELVKFYANILYNFSLQSDGNYYYETGLDKAFGLLGLYQYNIKTAETKVIQTGASGAFPFPYIVAQNGNLISIGKFGFYAYLQK